MPREVKKRGRRGEKKARDPEDYEGPQAKKRKLSQEDRIQDNDHKKDAIGTDYDAFRPSRPELNEICTTTTFYGLLTEEEQQYYANVNSKLVSGDFESPQDKLDFVDAVHRESKGKEIKIASSQACSRYIEIIIKQSSEAQLRSLLLAYLQDLEYLIQHRFGSHCCETLILQSARYVNPKSDRDDDDSMKESLNIVLLLLTDKLKTNAGFYFTEKFASHVLRAILLVLSGEPKDPASHKDSPRSEPKDGSEEDRSLNDLLNVKRKVPRSFIRAWKDIANTAVKDLDTTYLRALATHPIGSPVLQLLMRLELSDEENKSKGGQFVFQKLIPDVEFEIESSSSRFISSLAYDVTGAHLVEILVRYLPGKIFKKMYKNLFKDRIGKLAKNEIAGYVASSILERIGKDDLAEAQAAILVELPGLVERNRLAIIRSLVDRCVARNVSLDALQKALHEVYGPDSEKTIIKMLKFGVSNTSEQNTASGKTETRPQYVCDLHGSLLAQTLLNVPGTASFIQESLLQQSEATVSELARNTISSRMIQAALVRAGATPQFRRKFIPLFYSCIRELSLDTSGSYVVDALWYATQGLHFMKQKIAKLLLQSEVELRASMSGRTVWRNWSMDLYQRRPQEWESIAKSAIDHEDGAGSRVETGHRDQKSALRLAQERHMQTKTVKSHDRLAVVEANA